MDSHITEDFHSRDIPSKEFSNVHFEGLISPVVQKVFFMNNESSGFDLDRINQVINQYYQLSEYIIRWHHSIHGKVKYIKMLTPFCFVPAVRRYKHKMNETLPPDMMSTGDIGIYIDINDKKAVVDTKKLIDNYPQYIDLFTKYKSEHEKRKFKVMVKRINSM
ncbi:ribonuclease J [Acrasis kona]|uniref:Ribonuclease J n=1 Tax=Acrasis kona TaxID=1008807 RepID=A0AAW2YZ92_9EUKA